MSKKIKKYLIVLLLLSPLSFGTCIPIVNGENPPAPPPSGNSDPTAIQSPNSTKFEVSKYLTAPGQGQNYLKSSNPIASFIIQIINFLVLTIGSLCFLTIVVGGFTLLISNGNENLVNKGKEMITYALIGLVIVLLSYVAVAFVQSLFYELPGK